MDGAESAALKIERSSPSTPPIEEEVYFVSVSPSAGADREYSGVSRTDALTYACSAALLAVVALAASWIPAQRALRVDPMVALRHE